MKRAGTQTGTQVGTQTGTQVGTQTGTQVRTQTGTQVGTQTGTQVGTCDLRDLLHQEYSSMCNMLIDIVQNPERIHVSKSDCKKMIIYISA